MIGCLVMGRFVMKRLAMGRLVDPMLILLRIHALNADFSLYEYLTILVGKNLFSWLVSR